MFDFYGFELLSLVGLGCISMAFPIIIIVWTIILFRGTPELYEIFISFIIAGVGIFVLILLSWAFEESGLDYTIFAVCIPLLYPIVVAIMLRGTGKIWKALIPVITCAGFFFGSIFAIEAICKVGKILEQKELERKEIKLNDDSKHLEMVAPILTIQ